MTTIVAAAVIRRDGRILLTRRMKNAHFGGYWEFPGGKLEPGEAPEAAVVRECREECDIGIRVIDILDVTFHRYGERDVLLLFYDCELVEGEVKHLAVDEHVWCTPEELASYALPPADLEVLRKIRRAAGLD